MSKENIKLYEKLRIKGDNKKCEFCLSSAKNYEEL